MSDLKRIVLEKDTSLQLNPFGQNRDYGFTLQNFDNDKLVTTVHYKATISCVTTHDDSFSFEINRKQIYIDNLAPDLKVEQIADASSEAIFPVELKVSGKGEIQEITNHKRIINRWFPIKERLSKYYQGNIISEMLLKIETTLVNKNLLTESICKTWFFHLYFKPLYTNYTQEKPNSYSWESPIFGNQVISYDVQQTMEEYYSATDKIFINCKGKSIDKRSIDEVLNGCNYPKSEMAGIEIQPLESEMEVQYKLYGEDRSIFSIIGTYKTKITEQKYKTTQIEIYHLPENSSFRPHSKPQQKHISLFVDADEPVKKKKGFWDKFF